MSQSHDMAEQLLSYLAGGLTNEERYALQERLESDAGLAAELDALREFDDRLRTMFATTKPPATLEDRLIRSLRENTLTARRSRAFGPAVRWLCVAAGVLLVVAIGFAGVQVAP
jgi:anti-sigma factor RsiW